MSIFLQLSLILLIFLPGDVSDMRAEEQGVPFVFSYAVLLHSLQRSACCGEAESVPFLDRF